MADNEAKPESSKIPPRKRLTPEERRNLRQKKRYRLIVRNLPFNISEDKLRKTFAKYGEICEIHLPRKDGKIRGFGFVSMENHFHALKAIKGANGMKLLGRVIAVDHSLPKKQFDLAKDAPKLDHLFPKKSDNEGENDDSNGEEKDGENESEEAEDSENEDDEESDEFDDLKRGREEEEDDDENEVDILREKRKNVRRTYSESDEEDEEDEINDDNPKKRRKPRDVKEGRTVFIKNMSFDTTREQLKEVLSKYGKVEYCICCIDKETGHTRGTAFAKFSTVIEAEKCIQQSTVDLAHFFIDGRQLELCLAVSKGEVMRKAQERHLKSRDKRNLYLAKEGLVQPETPEAENVSVDDLELRYQLEVNKRRHLKNILRFVSRTRLAIHNLPEKIDSRRLKQICLRAVDDKRSVINECVVMRNLSGNSRKLGISKGYGYVEFNHHLHALKALRVLNNNPSIFGPNKRPIVFFSIENVDAVKVKQRRLENNQKYHQQLRKTATEMANETIYDADFPFMGVKAQPFREHEEIAVPKLNRKLFETFDKIKKARKEEKKHQQKFADSNLPRKRQKRMKNRQIRRDERLKAGKPRN